MCVQLPNIVHPKIFTVNGFRIQVVAYCSLTDDQALKAAMVFVRDTKLKQSQKKSVIQALMNLDKGSAGLI